MPDRNDYINVAALDAKVGILTTDVEGLNNRISGLDEKFDKVMTGFAGEFRAAIAGLSTQFSERNKTPWGVLISGMGVVLTVVTVIGHQTLAPITSEIAALAESVVPRKEVEFRYSVNDKRLNAIELELAESRKREYDDLRRQIDELHKENHLLKYPSPSTSVTVK